MEYNDKYYKRKMREIEAEIAVATAVNSMIACMFGKVTDGSIEARDEATKNVHKIVRQLLKRYGK